MAAKPIIVFDLGNVLISWDLDKLYAPLIPDENERAAFYKILYPIDAENDRGRSWAEILPSAIKLFPDKEPLFIALRDHWIKTLGYPIDGTVKILESLKTQGYRLYVGSNWGEETFALARPRMPFLDLFDGLQVSYAIKLLKPDIAFYEHLEKSFGFDLKESVFIDDRADNIEAAKKAGMDGILFLNPSQLSKDLALRGVTVPTC
jgi:2-haloacid dehalogenase